MESLTSYIARLAEYHCVSTEKLILAEIVPLLSKKGYIFSPRSVKWLFGECLKILEWQRTTTAERREVAIIQALEDLTLRSDLSCFKVDLLVQFDIFSLKQAWCPICYEEWRATERVIYNPWYWLMKEVKVCLRHERQSLIQRCPHCQMQFPTLSRRSRPGYCSICQRWLGSFSQTSAPTSKVVLEHEPLWQSLLEDDEKDKVSWQFIFLDNMDELAANTLPSFSPPKWEANSP